MASFAFAQPVFTLHLDDTLGDSQALLESQLLESGFEVARVLDIGQTIRARGIDFMPLQITVLEANETILKILEEDPRLSAILPLSLALYEQEGVTSISFTDPSQLMSFFALSEEGLQSLDGYFENLKLTLVNLGELEQGENIQLEEAPYLTASLPEDNLEDSMFFYTSLYEEQNMNLVAELELGRVKQAWLCNAGFAAKAFLAEPRLATIAPCRIFAYQDVSGIQIATMNSAYAEEAFPNILADEEASSAFKSISEIALAVFDAMGAE